MRGQLSSALVALECTACGATCPPDQLINVCPSCGKVLFASYDLEHISATLRKEDLRSRETTLWRYRELLPVSAGDG